MAGHNGVRSVARFDEGDWSRAGGPRRPRNPPWTIHRNKPTPATNPGSPSLWVARSSASQRMWHTKQSTLWTNGHCSFHYRPLILQHALRIPGGPEISFRAALFQASFASASSGVGWFASTGLGSPLPHPIGEVIVRGFAYCSARLHNDLQLFKRAESRVSADRVRKDFLVGAHG